MTERILAIGIDDLPKQIKSVSWNGIKNGEQVNISDYDIVFIDYTYFLYNRNEGNLIDNCLNETKFFEVMASGIDLFILGIPSYSYRGYYYNLYL